MSYQKSTTSVPAPATTEVKTTVYTADLGKRTEGAENWNQTASASPNTEPTFGEKASAAGQQAKEKATELGQQAKEKASELSQQAKESAYSASASAKQSAQKASETVQEKWEEGKEKVSEALEAGKEKLAPKWEEGKEKVNEAVEAGKVKLAHASDVAGQKYEEGKEKLSHASDVAGEKFEEGKARASESTQPSVIDRVKETVGSATHSVVESAENTASVLQQKGHEWAESAQQSLEAAREKAREVFVGATSKSDDTVYVKPGETAYGGAGQTEVKVKSDETLGGGNRIKVETHTETKTQ